MHASIYPSFPFTTLRSPFRISILHPPHHSHLLPRSPFSAHLIPLITLLPSYSSRLTILLWVRTHMHTYSPILLKGGCGVFSHLFPRRMRKFFGVCVPYARSLSFSQRREVCFFSLHFFLLFIPFDKEREYSTGSGGLGMGRCSTRAGAFRRHGGRDLDILL